MLLFPRSYPWPAFLLPLTSKFFTGVMRWVAIGVFFLHVTKSNLNSICLPSGLHWQVSAFSAFFLFLCRNIRTKIPITLPRRQIDFDFHIDMNKYLVDRNSSSSTKLRNMSLIFFAIIRKGLCKITTKCSRKISCVTDSCKSV